MAALGAAGSSGTVTEPFLIEAKFPTPNMHVHYARGSSLAEAYYQAVASPYQLLIVGDPLCQPWARRPQIVIAGLSAGETVSGKRTMTATVSPASVDRIEWLLDGHRMAITTPSDRITLDCDTLPDGFHELRAVAVNSGPIETQGRAIVPFTVGAHGRACQIVAFDAVAALGPDFEADLPSHRRVEHHCLSANAGACGFLASRRRWKSRPRCWAWGPCGSKHGHVCRCQPPRPLVAAGAKRELRRVLAGGRAGGRTVGRAGL